MERVQKGYKCIECLPSQSRDQLGAVDCCYCPTTGGVSHCLSLAWVKINTENSKYCLYLCKLLLHHHKVEKKIVKLGASLKPVYESGLVFSQNFKLTVYKHKFIIIIYLSDSSWLIASLLFLVFISAYDTAITPITGF